MGFASNIAYAQNTWKLVDQKTGTWERSVIIDKKTLTVHARVLGKEKKTFLVVQHQCTDTSRMERLEWYAGDVWGRFFDCLGRESKTSQVVLIEYEVREGLPSFKEKP